jgi:hypothetical protein
MNNKASPPSANISNKCSISSLLPQFRKALSWRGDRYQRVLPAKSARMINDKQRKNAERNKCRSLQTFLYTVQYVVSWRRGEIIAGSDEIGLVLTQDTSSPLYEQMSSTQACLFIANESNAMLFRTKDALPRYCPRGPVRCWTTPGSDSVSSHTHQRLLVF